MVQTKRTESEILFESSACVWDFKKEFDPKQLSQPISFVELMTNRHHQGNNSDSSFDIIQNDTLMAQRKSCVKAASTDAFGSNRKIKSVKFATNKETDQVWCIVKEYEKEDDEEVLKELFWSAGELHDNFTEDKEELRFTKERFKYKHALAAAYKASAAAATSNEEIDIDFETLQECSEARGMELEVYPLVRQFARKHRRAVLVVQDTLRDEGRPMYDDLSLNLIRKASIKYSRPIRMVATRLAEFDKRDSLLSESEPLVSDDDISSDGDDEARNLEDSIMKKSEDAMASYSEFKEVVQEREGEQELAEDAFRGSTMKRSEASVF